MSDKQDDKEAWLELVKAHLPAEVYAQIVAGQAAAQQELQEMDLGQQLSLMGDYERIYDKEIVELVHGLQTWHADLIRKAVYPDQQAQAILAFQVALMKICTGIVHNCKEIYRGSR